LEPQKTEMRSEGDEMGYRILRGLKILVIAIVACTVFAYVVMRLWNWLVPGIFGWHAITFVQAVGLLVLSKILFGGFHRHGGRGGGPGRRHWKREMKRRFEHMSPEEREKFRAGMRGGWGHVGPEERERFRAEVRARWGCGPREQREDSAAEKGTV
jgi:hypothetical protein